MSHAIQPVIRLTVARIYMTEYGMEPRPAYDAAERLLYFLHQHDLDIVRGDWPQKPQPAESSSVREFRWEDIPTRVKELDASGFAPWDRPELKT